VDTHLNVPENTQFCAVLRCDVCLENEQLKFSAVTSGELVLRTPLVQVVVGDRSDPLNCDFENLSDRKPQRQLYMVLHQPPPSFGQFYRYSR
jgi:hypothetical protein